MSLLRRQVFDLCPEMTKKKQRGGGGGVVLVS